MFRRITSIVLLSTFTLLPMSTVNAQESVKAHHDGHKFRNPWPSFIPFGFGSVIKLLATTDVRNTTKRITAQDRTKKVEMNWNLIKQQEQLDNITVTWLGHACIFLQMKGFNIIFDPIFSDRCAPFQFLGPKRFTEPPCALTDLPKIDAVIISHNHYDHMDANTISQIDQHSPDCKFYVPLGNKSWFKLSNQLDSQGHERVIELDWWDTDILKKSGATLRFTCTPAQHQSGRTLFDKDKTLWSSWCIEGLDKNENPTEGRIFFGGDTGYRAIPANTKPEDEYNYEYLDTLPHCPAFKEIGEKVGPFDLALIPIGAYSPRWFMSAVHCSPEDAVDLHKDINSKHSIGIHWGTFVLTDEPVHDPPKRLEAALRQRKIDTKEFHVLPLGGSYTVSIK